MDWEASTAKRMEEYVLIVDDETAVRELMNTQLGFLGFHTQNTGDPLDALRIAEGPTPPALVLLDIEMPGFSGLEILRRIKKIDENIQVVMVSGLHDLGTVRECLRAGAYDYLAKPFELEDLHNTVNRAFERRRLILANKEYQENLEQKVAEKTEEIRNTRDIALLTLAKLAESRDSETGMHLERMPEYSRILAQTLSEGPYADQVDAEFVEWVFKSSPLHDIGKVGIPDAILRKAGPLTDDERAIMRTHTTIGGDTLRSVLEKFTGPSFLNMAMEICYSHHERWDGGGYPKRISGEDIPLSARIVAIADAYDAITSLRPYKPAYDHDEAVRRIVVDKGKHFDPVLVDAFMATQERFAIVKNQLQTGPLPSTEARAAS